MSIEWNREEIRSKLTRLLNRISGLALEDDIISDDEQELIDVIKGHVLSFEEKIEDMVKQHDDIDHITAEVKEIFENAIEAAARQARRDGTITADELILIDRLAKSLRNENISDLLQSTN